MLGSQTTKYLSGFHTRPTVDALLNFKSQEFEFLLLLALVMLECSNAALKGGCFVGIAAVGYLLCKEGACFFIELNREGCHSIVSASRIPLR